MSGKSHDLISTSLYYVSKHATRERIKSQLNCHVTFRRQLHRSILSSPYYQLLLTSTEESVQLEALAAGLLQRTAPSATPPNLLRIPILIAEWNESSACKQLSDCSMQTAVVQCSGELSGTLSGSSVGRSSQGVRTSSHTYRRSYLRRRDLVR